MPCRALAPVPLAMRMFVLSALYGIMSAPRACKRALCVWKRKSAQLRACVVLRERHNDMQHEKECAAWIISL